ncbi:MAG: hypothetical protein ACO1OY_02465 [Ramlibacter sp.]
MNDERHTTQAIGKYLVSPLTKVLENGWYACSVTIRSGSGRGTTDRVVRLTRLFRDRITAAEYALQEGLRWVASPGSAAPLVRFA